MLQAFFDNKPWFAPKRFGIGTGWPIVWQGWVMLAVHVAMPARISRAFAHKPLVVGILVVTAVLLPLLLYAKRTRGGWKWRSGGEA